MLHVDPGPSFRSSLQTRSSLAPALSTLCFLQLYRRRNTRMFTPNHFQIHTHASMTPTHGTATHDDKIFQINSKCQKCQSDAMRTNSSVQELDLVRMCCR